MSTISVITISHDHLEDLAKDTNLSKVLVMAIKDRLLQETGETPIGFGSYVIDILPNVDATNAKEVKKTLVARWGTQAVKPSEVGFLLTVQELNELAHRKGFRLITLRRSGEKPKKLGGKGRTR